jgi:hypothetical protein
VSVATPLRLPHLGGYGVSGVAKRQKSITPWSSWQHVVVNYSHGWEVLSHTLPRRSRGFVLCDDESARLFASSLSCQTPASQTHTHTRARDAH